MKTPFVLTPGSLTLRQLRQMRDAHDSFDLAAESWEAIRAGAAAVEAIVAKGAPAYGINTGFGKLAQKHIANDQLETLQRNLVLSHSAGVGAPLPDSVVKLILLLKIVSLARGRSGVRPVI
ncbi:MAG: aromatic amino acid lyase, partial [Betaproteobacteria bacterium]|nr:aromatic amino acid lyase [Betaproteobacteria bacterium]